MYSAEACGRGLDLNEKYTNTIRNNWVYNDLNIDAGTIYLDNGASYWNVTHNVIINSPNTTALFMTGGIGDPSNAAHNSMVDHLWYQNVEAPANGCLKNECVVDEATTFLVPAMQPLPQLAQAIVAAAGANFSSYWQEAASFTEIY